MCKCFVRLIPFLHFHEQTCDPFNSVKARRPIKISILLLLHADSDITVILCSKFTCLLFYLHCEKKPPNIIAGEITKSKNTKMNMWSNKIWKKTNKQKIHGLPCCKNLTQAFAKLANTPKLLWKKKFVPDKNMRFESFPRALFLSILPSIGSSLWSLLCHRFIHALWYDQRIVY